MRKNIHYILTLFHILNKQGSTHKYLESKLNPNFVKYKYTIKNFHPLGILKESDICKTMSTAKTKIKSEQRYIEVCFETLDDYSKKNNRKYNDEILKNYKTDIKKLLAYDNFDDMDKVIYSILDSIAQELESDFINSVV